MRAITALNARFRDGGPASALLNPSARLEPERLGVYVHVWEGSEHEEHPWLPGSKTNRHCWTLSDSGKKVKRQCERLTASLLYRSMPNRWNGSIPVAFNGVHGGLVLRPTKQEVRCGYPLDGCSRWKPDGCGLASVNSRAIWCQPNVTKWGFDLRQRVKCPIDRRPSSCPAAWRPQDLHTMLATAAQLRPWPSDWSAYNEIIVSPTTYDSPHDQQLADWKASLPRLVEAVFYATSPRHRCCVNGPSLAAEARDCTACANHERRVHAAFLSTYGLSAAQVPLAELRIDSWERPFRLAA